VLNLKTAKATYKSADESFVYFNRYTFSPDDGWAGPPPGQSPLMTGVKDNPPPPEANALAQLWLLCGLEGDEQLGQGPKAQIRRRNFP
jgi:hypothetical protein